MFRSEYHTYSRRLATLAVCGWWFVSVPEALAVEAVVAIPQVGGTVELVTVGRGGEVRGTIPGVARWHSFDLRDPWAHVPGSSAQVVEKGPALPHLSVRGATRLVAFSSATESGLAALGAWGVSVLRQGGPGVYVPDEGGAIVDESGALVALTFAGGTRGRVVVMDVRGERPVALDVDLPVAAEKVEARSLTVLAGALLFLARTADGYALYRAHLTLGSELSVGATELVADGFEAVERSMASNRAAAAFLAGADDDEYNVYVVRATGDAVNLTRLPGPYLRHRPDDQHLAIDRPGEFVAYSLARDGEPETYVHDVTRPGLDGRTHVTNDGDFNPYIDQEVFLFFDGSSNLVFAAGHSPDTTDVFRVQGQDVDGAINLTRTGSTLESPFLTRGSIFVQRAAVLGDLVLLGGSGFSGNAPSVVGVSASTGEALYQENAIRIASRFVRLGSDYYCVGVSSEQATLYRIHGAVMTAIDSAPTPQGWELLAAAESLAFASLPGRGVYLLSAAAEPRQILSGDALSLTAFDAAAQVLFYGETVAAGPRSMAWSLTQETAWAFEPSVATGEILAVSYDPADAVPPDAGPPDAGPPDAVFLRGDASGDGELDLRDPLVTLRFVFRGAVVVECHDAADTDDNGALSILDAVHTLRYLFAAGPPPSHPFPGAGVDLTSDGLDCVAR